ncbi:regulator of G-protein signaling 7-binding protein A [Caerostris darwini]|uniref:Regulator of G-protein signaling 7-binding protein A n=1 Tax=Caerostris darwini TaxID=1538125 RepID=A0AAV4WPT1_9ARAC|nr:regulator of G-protein signaling 7-binding protein A [Caerostris darwini]
MSCGAEVAKRRTDQASISGGIRAAINRRLSRPGVYDSPEASKSSELQLADCQRIIEELNTLVASFRDLLIHIGKGHDNPDVRDKMRGIRKNA